MTRVPLSRLITAGVWLITHHDDLGWDEKLLVLQDLEFLLF